MGGCVATAFGVLFSVAVLAAGQTGAEVPGGAASGVGTQPADVAWRYDTGG